MLPVENPLGPEGQAGTYKVKLNQTDENGRVVVDPAWVPIPTFGNLDTHTLYPLGRRRSS